MWASSTAIILNLTLVEDIEEEEVLVDTPQVLLSVNDGTGNSLGELKEEIPPTKIA